MLEDIVSPVPTRRLAASSAFVTIPSIGRVCQLISSSFCNEPAAPHLRAGLPGRPCARHRRRPLDVADRARPARRSRSLHRAARRSGSHRSRISSPPASGNSSSSMWSPIRGGRSPYRLTALGDGLRSTVEQLGLWSARSGLGAHDPGASVTTVRSAAVGVQAILSAGELPAAAVHIDLVVDGEHADDRTRSRAGRRGPGRVTCGRGRSGTSCSLVELVALTRGARRCGLRPSIGRS